MFALHNSLIGLWIDAPKFTSKTKQLNTFSGTMRGMHTIRQRAKLTLAYDA